MTSAAVPVNQHCSNSSSSLISICLSKTFIPFVLRIFIIVCLVIPFKKQSGKGVYTSPPLKKNIFAYDCSFNREILGKKKVYFKSNLELENLIKYYDNYRYEKNDYKKVFTQNFINKKYLEILLNQFK